MSQEQDPGQAQRKGHKRFLPGEGEGAEEKGKEVKEKKKGGSKGGDLGRRTKQSCWETKPPSSNYKPSPVTERAQVMETDVPCVSPSSTPPCWRDLG